MDNQPEFEETLVSADYTSKFSWADAGITFFCGLAVGFFIGVLAR